MEDIMSTDIHSLKSDHQFTGEASFFDENFDFNFEEFYILDEEELDLITSKDKSLLNKEIFQLCTHNFKFENSLPLSASNGDMETVQSYINKGVDINITNEFGNTALHLGSYYNQLVIVKFLLEHGADTTIKGKLLQHGQTPLHAAALAGNHDIVTVLQQQGAALNTADEFGDTALHLATRKGHLSVVKFLIENGSNLNLLNKVGHSALFIALQRNHVKICDILMEKSYIEVTDLLGNSMIHFCKDAIILSKLLEKGTLINVQNNKGLTPLLYAISSDRPEIVKSLLHYGADVNISDYSNTAPLHKAVVTSDLEIVELLIKAGASLEVRDDDGITPFQYAAIESRQDILQLLWVHGASVNSQNDLGYTPLYQICWNLALEGSEPLLEILKLGCDPRIQDYAGVTPLHVAVLMAPPECVEILIDRGADINCPDNFGRTPLIYSVERPEIVELLLKRGAQTNHLDSGHFTVLHHSITDRNLESLKLLLNHDPKLMAVTTKENASPLHLAAMEGPTEMLDILLSLRPDVNALDKYSCSPLHYATYGSNPEIVLKLINEGSDIFKMDDKGQTPYQYASEMRKKDICSVIAKTIKMSTSGITEEIPDLENIFSDMVETQDPNIEKENEMNQREISFDRVTDRMKTYDQNKTLDLKYLNKVLNANGIGAVSSKSGEAIQIRDSIHSIADQISKRLKEVDTLFESEIVFTGSAKENTKVGLPDEFDVMFVLKSFTNLCVPGERENKIFVPLKAKDPDNLPKSIKMLFGNDILLRPKLFQRFHKLLFKITTSSGFSWPDNIYQEIWRGGQTTDSEVTSIHNLIWRGREYKKLRISVDMVPSIYISQWPKDIIESPLINKEIKSLGFHVVAKPLEISKEDLTYYPGSYSTKQNLWRMSFTMAEQKILISQSESVLNAYRIMKALRHNEICPDLKISHPHFKRDATFSSAAVIPSYFLKMTFFHVLQSCFSQYRTDDESTTQVLLLQFFRHLESFMEEGSLPFFFLPEYNLLDFKLFHLFKADKIPTVMCKMLRMIATNNDNTCTTEKTEI